ncbi:MAG: lipoate--protein ligase family protein [Chitinophagales bacterium]
MTKLIISNSTNPYYNLAIEEWAVRNLDTSECDYLFLYQNKDCVVVGRNQNVFQEVNLRFCKANNIQICRRVSGGGTVFHDLENLNWTFISKFELNKVNNYKIFAEPIINVLKKLGLDAKLNERNAIMVGETKVSGQAQFTNRKNILSHGTLLINSDTKKLNHSITLKNKKVTSKASPSVRSTVKTIVDLLNDEISIKYVSDLILKECAASSLVDIENTPIQEKIKTLEATYQTNKWLYERSSKCIIEENIDGEDFILEIEKAKIVSVKTKKGEEKNQHPFLNMFYTNLLQ